MTRITIPKSIEAAVDVLAGVEALLRAKEWERSAVIAAFVTISEHGGDRSKTKTSLAPRDFAALGIAGLKSQDTVREYAKRWEETGRPRPQPGQRIDLDGLPEWRKPDPGTKYSPGKDEAVRRIIEQPRTVQRALAENPEFTRRIVADPTVARTVGTEIGRTDAGIESALEGYQQRPQEQTRRRETKERQAARAEVENVVYHFRTTTVMAALMGLDAVISEVVTTDDGRDFELDDTGAEHAKMVADALVGMASRLRAWANGDTSDPWDRGLADLLGGDSE